MRAAAAQGRVDRAVRALVARPLFWIVIIAALASWPVVWSARARIPPPPPTLGVLPSFQLTDEAGRSFGTRDLTGRVWVASFFATRCGEGCEAATRQLLRVQSRARHLEPALHLVSFSVDPLHDTPERLSAYARERRVSPRMWTFVTGDEAALRSLAEKALSPAPAEGDAVADLHGTALLLVDGDSRVRARYDPGAPDVVDHIVRDAALLVNAPAR